MYKYLPECHALQPVEGAVTEGGEGQEPLHERLCKSTVPQVATMTHQEWTNQAGMFMVFLGNTVGRRRCKLDPGLKATAFKIST